MSGHLAGTASFTKGIIANSKGGDCCESGRKDQGDVSPHRVTLESSRGFRVSFRWNDFYKRRR